MTASKSTGSAPKAETKPKTAKTAPAKKAAVVAKPAATPAAKKAENAPRVAADGKIKVTQLVGSIARKWDQRATLVGLGLGKRHRERVLENTPEVRGMVYKVRHLVKVEKA